MPAVQTVSQNHADWRTRESARAAVCEDFDRHLDNLKACVHWLIANGITTVFHGTTWSWEPGLRSAENARKLLDAIEALRPQLAADTRFHLRHETHNLDAETEIIQWLSEGRIDLFAFNDHSNVKPKKRNQLAERAGLSVEAINEMLDQVVAL